MGATSSVALTKIDTDIMTKAISNCKSTTASNTADLKNITISPPEWCGIEASVMIGQQATIDAECVINNAQDLLSKTISTLSSDAKGGIGISSSISVQDIRKHINSVIDNKCSSVKSFNDLKIDGLTIKACKSSIIQTADAKSACRLENTQKLVDEIQAENKSTATGYNPFDSPGFVIFIIIVAVILFGGGGYYLYRRIGGSGGQRMRFSRKRSSRPSRLTKPSRSSP